MSICFTLVITGSLALTYYSISTDNDYLKDPLLRFLFEVTLLVLPKVTSKSPEIAFNTFIDSSLNGQAFPLYIIPHMFPQNHTHPCCIAQESELSILGQLLLDVSQKLYILIDLM